MRSRRNPALFIYVRWVHHILMVTFISLNALFSGCVTSKLSRIDYTEREPIISDKKELSVMTWNIAHGRGLKFHQANIRDREELYRNLDGISETISRKNPDIVGFTEVDFSSSWSFKVDQLDYIAEKCGYSYTARVVTHVFHLGIYQVNFGDAVMSKYPIKSISSGYFRDGDSKKIIAIT